MYFVSRTLQEAETRYQMIEKVAPALVITTRRMRAYFQNHKIIVKTDYPTARILSKPDLAGRMITWSVELSEYAIRYQSRGAIKAQVLADFVAEMGQNLQRFMKSTRCGLFTWTDHQITRVQELTSY